jgi:pyruvate dehydrogenase complex dehydrogenase (E1) component
MPIIPDEARTFGMDPLFKEVGIYSALGQRYEPVDSNLVLSYREATDGQVLEEGITEAGSSASFQAAGTSYATHGEPMIPFYIFYSMFGFQRTGDEFWAFADARGRGFLLGATAGRTTLNGEGLQHEDGHSVVVASHYPNARVYDPAFAYETAAIVRDGLTRMYGPDPQDVFYYIALTMRTGHAPHDRIMSLMTTSCGVCTVFRRPPNRVLILSGPRSWPRAASCSRHSWRRRRWLSVPEWRRKSGARCSSSCAMRLSQRSTGTCII